MTGAKSILMLVLMHLSIPTYVLAAQPTAKAELSVADSQQITAWAGQWKRLIEAGDIEQMRDMYEPDAVLMSNGAPPQIGVDAILNFLSRNKVAGNKVTIDFVNEDLALENDRAYLTAKYWMTITLARGSTINVIGRSFLVFKKGQDKKWRLWKDIDNQAPDVRSEDRPN